MNIIPRFPRVMLDSETLPLYKILQFPIDHLTIQNFFDNPFLFFIHNFQRWWRFWNMTSNRIRQSWSEFDNIEDRMKMAYRSGKFQTIGTTTNLFDYFKRTQMLMRQLFGRLGSLNVTCIKVCILYL
jgi:hypothetical protein